MVQLNIGCSFTRIYDVQDDHYLHVSFSTLNDFREVNLETIISENNFSLSNNVDNITVIRHRTFIRPNQFKFTFLNTFTECGTGDGRSFSPSSGTSRTQININVDWNNSTHSFFRDAAPSTKYDSDCTSSDTRTTPL
ncbi:hypothetical protein GCM10008968_36440 [Bacillus horti]